MHKFKLTELTIDLNIEELESKIAPDGGETVLPLTGNHGHGHH